MEVLLSLLLKKTGLVGTNKYVSHIALNPRKDSIYFGGGFTKFLDKTAGCLGLYAIKSAKGVSLKSDSLVITGMSYSHNVLYYSKYDRANIEASMNKYDDTKVTSVYFQDSIISFSELGSINGSVYCLAAILDTKIKIKIYEKINDSFFAVKTSNPHLFGIRRLAIANYGNIVSGEFIGIADVVNPFSLGTLDFRKRNIFVIPHWDKNKNGTFEKGVDFILPNFSFKYSGLRFFTSTNSRGLVHWIIPTNKRSITFELQDYKLLTTLKKTIEVNLDSLVGDVIFLPVDFSINKFQDLKVKLKANSGRFRSSDKEESIYIEISNEGDESKNTGLTLNLDKRIQFIKSSLSPLSNVAGKISWSNINLNPGQTKTIELLIKAPSSSINLDETVQFVASLSSTDDFSENNVDSLNQSVASPSNFISKKFQFSKDGTSGENITVAPNDGYLDYLIRFVNTTDDTAHNVIVLDTIDAPMFVHTVQITAHSHYMTHTSYLIDNDSKLVVRYVFPNSELLPNPGMNSEINASAGFVSLRVFYNNTVPVNHSFVNTAHVALIGEKFIPTNSVFAQVASG